MPDRPLSASTKLFVGVLLLLAGVVSVAAWNAGTPAQDVKPMQTLERIDLNRADTATLQLLPGIGAVVAEHVVEHRETAGRFAVLDDLQDVRMIGPTVRRRVEPYVTLE